MTKKYLKNLIAIALIFVLSLSLFSQYVQKRNYQAYLSKSLINQVNILYHAIFNLEELLETTINMPSGEVINKVWMQQCMKEIAEGYRHLYDMAIAIRQYEETKSGDTAVESILVPIVNELIRDEMNGTNNWQLDKEKIILLQELTLEYKDIINKYYIHNVPNPHSSLVYNNYQLNRFENTAIKNQFWIDIIKEMDAASGRHDLLRS